MANVFDHFNLHGKTALVTGGATGLGYHMTRALARAGAEVIIAARREDVLRESAERLNAEPHIRGVRWHPVDLNNRESVAALAKHALETSNGIDIFIGNAGQDLIEPVLEIKRSSIDQIMQVNISANVELVQAFLPGMKAKHWGRFLFSSSISTIVTSPHEGIGMYTATKGAMNAFCRTLATEVGHDNITANSLVLGFFVTDMVLETRKHFLETQGEAAAHKFMEDFVGMTALGRAGEPPEVEGVIQLLASDAGSYITGSSLVIDGGTSIMLRPNGMVS